MLVPVLAKYWVKLPDDVSPCGEGEFGFYEVDDHMGYHSEGLVAATLCGLRAAIDSQGPGNRTMGRTRLSLRDCAGPDSTSSARTVRAE